MSVQVTVPEGFRVEFVPLDQPPAQQISTGHYSTSSVPPGAHPDWVGTLAGWRIEAQHQRRRAEEAEQQYRRMARYIDKDVWFWQGDGHDHPESMANDMIVVMSGADLQRLLRIVK